MPKKSTKKIEETKKRTEKNNSKLSEEFVDTIKNFLISFNDIPKEEKINLYGDSDFLDQFWNYFIQKNPDLKDKINKKNLQIYFQALEAKGYSIKNLTENTGKLTKEIGDNNLITEKAIIKIAIKKIKKELNGQLSDDFNAKFNSTSFKNIESLIGFRNERIFFLQEHKSEIDANLAKKLDDILISNGDILKELQETGKNINNPEGLHKREKYYKLAFDKLVTNQLSKEVKEIQKDIDESMSNIAETFKQFPPYFNQIFKIYPYDISQLKKTVPNQVAKINHFQSNLSEIEKQIANEKISDKEKIKLKLEKKQIKEKMEKAKWETYISYLQTKDKNIAEIVSKLVNSKFDFNSLSTAEQQEIVNILVKNKLEDTIKNKIPAMLDINAEGLQKFVTDLFDLKKMDISIPTSDGPIPIHFSKKEFLSTIEKKLPSILNGTSDLSAIKSLPLNFQVKLDEISEDFFENNIIFHSLFNDFKSKSGEVTKINDSYKVSLTKDGKIVQGYLSQYPPSIDDNKKDSDGQERYLYSQPITSPSDERNIITRDGTQDGKPVIIKKKEEKNYDIKVLEKKLNINGEAMGALLFGYVIGQQSMNAKISPKDEKEFGEKIGKLDTYKDINENYQSENGEGDQNNSNEKSKEETEKEKFLKERKDLKGYKFQDKEYAKNDGFTKGSCLWIRHKETILPPYQTGGDARLKMEIFDVGEKNFTLKFQGGELKLGELEGYKLTLPMNSNSIDDIKKIFGEDIYKMPSQKGKDLNSRFNVMTKSIDPDGKLLKNSFDNIKREGEKFKFSGGDNQGQDVKYFGYYVPTAGENPDEETMAPILYNFVHNSNGTFTVSNKTKFTQTDDKTKKTKEIKYSQDMDYTSFLLFISSKKLQPKSQKQADKIQKGQADDKEVPATNRRFSINSIFGFFKNTKTKIADGIKKYDEERTEELTDAIMQNGKTYMALGGFLSPFTRISESMETIGSEYFLERDSRVWKKIEKRKKFYEDMHFTTMWNMYLKPMLDGTKQIKPHYKMAALLLTTITKGKGPYNRVPQYTGKGIWISLMLGKEHQQRYLAIREKKQRELQQNAHIYGTVWADQTQNEIVELEMKYIVHVMDGRQYGNWRPDDENYYTGKWSRTFANTLDEKYNEFFRHSFVEGNYGKIASTTNFEFARFEYFRQLGDRPQQAIPYLKTMALKATTKQDWLIFEQAIMAGMLSGVFLNMVPSDTKSWIEKICRTRGFLPGLWIRDINQQTKLQRLLDIITNKSFSNKADGVGYNASYFKLGAMDGISNSGTVGFVQWIDNKTKKPGIFRGWLNQKNNLQTISEFVALNGKTRNGKTLLEMYADSKTNHEDRVLLKELYDKSMEKDEEIDNDVKHNPNSLKGSIFTKSQSIINEITNFKNSEFSTKTTGDKDEKQSIQQFREEVSKDIPKSKESEVNVEFFLKKFLNRFGEKGFQDSQKGEFLRRLKTVQKIGPSMQGADDILWYSIVGLIVKNSGNGQVPDELTKGLEAFKDFFKNNLDLILNPNMIEKTMGRQYIEDSQNPYEVGDWQEYVSIADPTILMTYSPQERKELGIGQKSRELKDEYKYINKNIYDLAMQLYKNNGIQNRFKKSYNKSDVKKSQTTNSQLISTLNPKGIKVKNPNIFKKTKKELQNNLSNNNPDYDEDNSFDYYNDYDLN